MSMKKILLTTYWSPAEAHTILMFLNELRDTLLAHYASNIADHHRQLQQNDQWDSDFENDFIP